MRVIGTAIWLAALWLLMSGLYKPLLLTLGGLSVLLVLWIIARMDRVDGDRVAVQLNPFRFARYFLWLLVEIAKSNLAVTRVILSPRLATRQRLFRVPSSQTTDLGRVIFATSITLTPGTISVATDSDEVLVHALAFHEDDIAAMADMDARVTHSESKGAG